MALPVTQGGIDYPDGGFSASGVVYALLDDLGELAARLGGIHVYDRRGYILWADDFRNGLGAWKTDTDGTGASVEVSAVSPKWPPYCLKLVGGSDGDQSCEITRQWGPVVEGGYGLELSIDFLSDFYDCRIELELDNSTLYYQPSIKLDANADKIYYLNSLGGWTELGDLVTLKHTWSGYHNLKLVVDFDTGYYIRFMLDDVEYDLSDYAIYTTPTFGNYHSYAFYYFRSRSGQNDYCYVDGVILTQNES